MSLSETDGAPSASAIILLQLRFAESFRNIRTKALRTRRRCPNVQRATAHSQRATTHFHPFSARHILNFSAYHDPSIRRLKNFLQANFFIARYQSFSDRDIGLNSEGNGRAGKEYQQAHTEMEIYPVCASSLLFLLGMKHLIYFLANLFFPAAAFCLLTVYICYRVLSRLFGLASPVYIPILMY